MRYSPLRHLITATMALAFMATVGACSSASPQALPETTATPAAPVPSTATPSPAAPTTTTPRATHSATSPPTVKNPCVPFRPEGGSYEAAVIATEQLKAPSSRCTTISVSDVRDPDSRPPTDTCGFFRIGFWPITASGSLTYTEPVIACSSHRTVLARNVPNNARYQVLYDVEHFDPEAEIMSHLTFRIWH